MKRTDSEEANPLVNVTSESSYKPMNQLRAKKKYSVSKNRTGGIEHSADKEPFCTMKLKCIFGLIVLALGILAVLLFVDLDKTAGSEECVVGELLDFIKKKCEVCVKGTTIVVAPKSEALEV